MEPEICPPWWPDLLWWLLHYHHHPEPPPEEWLRKLRDPVEEVLAGLTVYVQAQASFGAKQEQLRGQIQHAALQQMSGGMDRLAEVGKAGE